MQKYSGYQYTPAPQTEWDKLPMSEKTDVIKVCVHNGITSLQDIRTAYNNYKGGRNIFEGISDYSQKASEFGNFLAGGGEITYGKPYYSYDENGRKIDDTLNYNATFPEVVIIPDSQKSPAQRNADERFRQRSLRDYDQHKAQEYTEKQLSQVIREWNNSTEKKALDYAQAASTGIGIGVDIVSGLPIYSSLKGASTLSRAETPMDYVEGGLWLAPVLEGAYQTTKPVVKQAIQTAIDNGGFAISSPRIGKVFGKDVGQFTAWVPFNRPWIEGLSWINTGEPTADGLSVQYITSKHSGEARKLYDAVINKAREEGYPGIVTGRELISAPKTYSTLEHYYPNKVKLDDMGHWSNDNMTGLFEGPKKTVYTLDDFLKSASETPNERVHFLGAPRYRLETPSVSQPKLLDFGNVEDGTFKFTGFSEDPIQMHLKRAQAKGYDTSGINIYDLSKDTPENTAFIESIAKQYGLTPEQTKEFLLNHLDTHSHAANFNNTKNIIHDGTGDNLSARISHEIDHLLHKPDEPIPDGSYYPRIFKRADRYFSKHNNTELSARGSQLHDYFGHTGNEPITEDMLEYARQHYIKDTGLDNNMHDFLWTIKDNKKVADWLTKYATGIVPFGLFGTAVYNQNRE